MKQKACSLLHTLGGQKSKKIATWMVVGRRQQIKKKSPKRTTLEGQNLYMHILPLRKIRLTPDPDPDPDLVHLQT
jgi:hypothetical protein